MTEFKRRIESIISELQDVKDLLGYYSAPQEQYCSAVKVALISMLKGYGAEYDPTLMPHTTASGSDNYTRSKKFFAVKVLELNDEAELLQKIEQIRQTLLEYITETLAKEEVSGFDRISFNIPNIQILSDKHDFADLLRGIFVMKINEADSNETL